MEKEYTTVVVDAMGGDNAPDAMIQGAVDAITKNAAVQVILVGREEVIAPKLEAYTFDKARIRIVNASEEISCDEPPVQAIRRKKDSSIVVGQKLVANGEADAFLSAGSTGAVLVGGQLVVGRIRGIDRTPIATLIPTDNGVSLLIDSGANVDARASHLVQFARMGSIYMEHVIGVKNPRVAIVNVGLEEEKGNALVKETYPMLKACADINFTGSIEAREIPHPGADVIVCEGFTGNGRHDQGRTHVLVPLEDRSTPDQARVKEDTEEHGRQRIRRSAAPRSERPGHQDSRQRQSQRSMQLHPAGTCIQGAGDCK